MPTSPGPAAFQRIEAAAAAPDTAELNAAVADALRQGLSWTTIALALGTTRHEARQRFGL